MWIQILLWIVAVLFAGVVFSAIRALVYYFRSKKPPVMAFPEDFELTKEEISIDVPQKGTLKGWFIAHPSSDKTLVLTHGFAMNKGDVLKRTYGLAQEYNLFYFDFLGAGDSTGRTDVGFSEPGNIEAVIQFLRKNKPLQTRRIALYGISQGAGAAARYAAEHSDVACVILEAIYFSFKDIARRWIWVRRKTPYFPLVYGYLRFKELKLHCNLDDLSPKNTASRISVPVLLIHGEEDKVSPVENARRIYELIPGIKELWVVPCAGHTSCSREAGNVYRDRIIQFLKMHLEK